MVYLPILPAAFCAFSCGGYPQNFLLNIKSIAEKMLVSTAGNACALSTPKTVCWGLCPQPRLWNVNLHSANACIHSLLPFCRGFSPGLDPLLLSAADSLRPLLPPTPVFSQGRFGNRHCFFFFSKSQANSVYRSLTLSSFLIFKEERGKTLLPSALAFLYEFGFDAQNGLLAALSSSGVTARHLLREKEKPESLDCTRPSGILSWRP